MASSALAQMLDELMGRDRNLAPTEKRSEPKWDDSEVCKYYLSEFCPHEMFVNTRADLGTCDKVHDELLKKEYQKSARRGKMGYEHDFLRYLQGLINDVEKRIRRGHVRLALNTSQQQGSMNGNPASQKEEKIAMLTEKINNLVTQAEELGCQGNVEEAQGIMKLCDQFNDERTHLQNTAAPMQYNEPMKAMEVCTVCGALLVVDDAQQRVDEHIMGKQHSGYARIRAYVEGKRIKAQSEEEERESKLKTERDERESMREKEREDREKEREAKEKEREEIKKAEDQKLLEKEKEREERKKEREARKEKEKEEGRKRRRSRSRSHGRRSRSRERKRRSRSRSRHGHRSRSKSRDRHRSRRGHRSRSHGRRSRSHERHRHSRSHDKDRSSGKSSKERSASKDKESARSGGGGDGDTPQEPAPGGDVASEKPDPDTADAEPQITEGETN